MTANMLPTLAAYLEFLLNNREEVNAFYRSLNINYSAFFREPLTFALLEHIILPQLVDERAGHGELRAWVAGCAAGQEAYSLAILLEEINAVRATAVPYRIFATDISEEVLEIAQAGIYEADAVLNVRQKHLLKYFTKRGGAYIISGKLGERIAFSKYDLLDKQSVNPPESIFGSFDIVMCCNLLYYYRPEIRRFILDKMWHSLAPRGYFVTGETERAYVKQSDGLRMVSFPAAVFQKTGQGR